MSKIIKNWAIVFVVLFIWSYVWHNIIFGTFYQINLAQIARYAEGLVAPLMVFLALGNIMITFLFAKFLPASSNNTKQFVVNGLIMGLATWGSFAVISHAIFTGWTTPLMIADVSYGLTAGVIGGIIMKYRA